MCFSGLSHGAVTYCGSQLQGRSVGGGGVKQGESPQSEAMLPVAPSNEMTLCTGVYG